MYAVLLSVDRAVATKAGTGPDDLKGMVRWGKPGPRNGPNNNVLNITPPPPAREGKF